ncbi:MAG: lysophospholipid acyltransferase family protein [Candidatus Thiodiazotropha sp.]
MVVRIFYHIWRWMHVLPLSWLHAIGRLIGNLYRLIPNRERRIIDINLRLCFPQKPEPEIQALRNQTLQQMGCTLMELSAVWFRSLEQATSLICSVEGEVHLQRDPGQGLLVLAPHIGCWEIVGLDLQRRGQVTNLYRPPRVAFLDDVMKQARERGGAELVPTDNRGVKRLLATLKAGGISGILPDQQPKSDKGAVFAPFFHTPALTMLLVNRLARKTGAKLVLACAERLEQGRGYRVHYLAPPAGIDDEDPVKAATALNQGVEQLIALFPSQYQWSYKRFSRQPEGLTSPYRNNS